jgi:hypothetical protein
VTALASPAFPEQLESPASLLVEGRLASGEGGEPRASGGIERADVRRQRRSHPVSGDTSLARSLLVGIERAIEHLAGRRVLRQSLQRIRHATAHLGDFAQRLDDAFFQRDHFRRPLERTADRELFDGRETDECGRVAAQHGSLLSDCSLLAFRERPVRPVARRAANRPAGAQAGVVEELLAERDYGPVFAALRRLGDDGRDDTPCGGEEEHDRLNAKLEGVHSDLLCLAGINPDSFDGTEKTREIGQVLGCARRSGVSVSRRRARTPTRHRIETPVRLMIGAPDDSSGRGGRPVVCTESPAVDPRVRRSSP